MYDNIYQYIRQMVLVTIEKRYLLQASTNLDHALNPMLQIWRAGMCVCRCVWCMCACIYVFVCGRAVVRKGNALILVHLWYSYVRAGDWGRAGGWVGGINNKKSRSSGGRPLLNISWSDTKTRALLVYSVLHMFHQEMVWYSVWGMGYGILQRFWTVITTQGIHQHMC